VTYDIDHWPDISWRLFADDSVWNTPLERLNVDPNSATYIASMTADGPPKDTNHKVLSDWGFPLYFGKVSSPLYTIALTETSASFEKEINGLQVHCPKKVQPSTATDGVFRLIDQVDGFMYHFQQAKVDNVNRVIHAWRSYRLETYGSGFHNVKEPPTGVLPIRPEELAAGSINHTIGLHAKCLSGHSVAPYDLSGTKGQQCVPDDATIRISMGNVVFCDLEEADIVALSAPTWAKAILRGLSTYGALVGFNGSNSWSLTYEAPQDRTAFGKPDPYTALGLPATMSIAHLLDPIGGWAQHLHVLAPFPRP
jgi:hypothetical protein